MVDVGTKEPTRRRAEAQADVTMSPQTRDLVFGGGLPKGDAVAVVRLAGIMAAKRTAELVPLCHPLQLTNVGVEVEPTETGATIAAVAESVGVTGVEMEAMTAAAVASLALYDMVKGVERGVTIGPVRLTQKLGGRSGEWAAE